MRSADERPVLYVLLVCLIGCCVVLLAKISAEGRKIHQMKEAFIYQFELEYPTAEESKYDEIILAAVRESNK